MERGRVVRSLKGRNKGKSAVVLSVEGNAAFIADGKEYPNERMDSINEGANGTHSCSNIQSTSLVLYAL